jgi:hypothetical protein
VISKVRVGELSPNALAEPQPPRRYHSSPALNHHGLSDQGSAIRTQRSGLNKQDMNGPIVDGQRTMAGGNPQAHTSG